MKRQVMILGMVLVASACFMRVGAAEPPAEPAVARDRVMVLQDENFFLQDEIKKLQAELIDKDNALKKLLLEREAARYDLDGVKKENEALEAKVGSLQKMIAARDAELPRKEDVADMPCRSQAESAVKELQVMTMTLEEKNARMMTLMTDAQTFQHKLDILTGEKLSLLQSLKKISAEYDALKARADGDVAQVKSDADEKVKDFQVRLSAEQTLVQEKILQAKKPLEERIAGMEAACKVRMNDAGRQAALDQALLQDKARKLEQQIVLLRENSGLELKKAQDAAAAEIKSLKDQLSGFQKAVKK